MDIRFEAGEEVILFDQRHEMKAELQGGSLDSNPNRMTILLNENNQIVMTMWD